MSATTAHVVSGITDSNSDQYVGLSIASIRSKYGTMLAIPQGSRAVLNGAEVTDETTIVESFDELVFDRPTGTKG